MRPFVAHTRCSRTGSLRSRAAERYRWLVGTGPDTEMALLVILGSRLVMSVGIIGYLVRVVRDAEDILPDHDAAPMPETSVSPAAA